ncbi:MAG: EI24 domain-containing protein [Polyangiales bacterium]
MGLPRGASRRPNTALQFIGGVLALFRGVGFLWRTKAAWPLAAVPVVVCSVLCVASIAAAIEYVPKLMAAVWPGLTDTLGGFGSGVVRFVVSAITAILGMFLAVFLTPPLSAPALERLVLVRERELGVPPRPAAGFFRELRCAIVAQLIATGLFGPVLLGLSLVTWLAPPAAIVTFPLKLIVLALLTAWSLLDYPLSLRGEPARRRFALIRANAPRTLGFGLTLALAFMVPLLPLLLLPAAVAAAAEIAVELERHPD